MGWLTGWQYRRAITVQNQTATDLTDFQVKIELNSSNFDFSKADPNGADIRITTDDGTTIIPHWIEKWDSTNEQATIWTKVPSIPASGSTTLYIYYGNANAEDTSDGDAVFEFFDDFTQNTLGSRWIQTDGSSGAVSIQDSVLRIQPKTSDDADGIYVRTAQKFDYGKYVVRNAWCVYYTQSNHDLDPDTPLLSPDSSKTGYNSDGATAGDVFIYNADDGEIVLWGNGFSSISTGIQSQGCHVGEIYAGTSGGKAWINVDGVYKEATLPSFSASQYYIYYAADSRYANYYDVDWVAVRKYTSPEPSLTVGEEEQAIVETLTIDSLTAEPSTVQINVAEGETEKTITATVDYTADNVSITSIEWYVDGTLIDSGLNETIDITFTYLQEGEHEIKVIVRGTGNDTGTEYTDQATTTVTVEKIGEWLTGLTEKGAYLHDEDGNVYPIFSATIKYDVERLVDVADVVVSRTANIEVGKEVAIYWNGNPIFAGYVTEAKKKEVLALRIENYASELFRVRATEVFRDKSPEEIVQYLVENYTGLQYASTETSGVTISKYVVDADLVGKVIQDMAKLLDWQILVDEQKRLYFVPKGSREANYSLVVGANCALVGSWEFDLSRLMNDITLKGDKQSFTKEDTFTGDGTTHEFILTYKPIGSIRITVDGTEMKPEADYTVDADDRKISFMTPPANGANIVVQYDYMIPIVIMASNDESIAKYGRHSAVIEAKWIKTMADARNYVRKLLELYAEPLVRGTLKVAGIRTDIKEGDIVTVIDSRNGINQSMQITKVEYYIPDGYTKVKVGTSEILLYDWQAEVQERIKQLEQVLSTIETIQRQLGFKEPITVKIKIKRFTIKTTELASGAKWNDTSAVWDGEGVFYAKTYPFVLDHTKYGLLDTVNIRMDIPYNEWKTHYEVER